MEKGVRIDSVGDKSIPFGVVGEDFSEDMPESGRDREDVWRRESTGVIVEFRPAISRNISIRRRMTAASGEKEGEERVEVLTSWQALGRRFDRSCPRFSPAGRSGIES